MNQTNRKADQCVGGGVDTHKDIHVAAVVNELNKVISSESFPKTRHGYKKNTDMDVFIWQRLSRRD